MGWAAIAYFQLRLPTPQTNDISRLLSVKTPSLRVIVRGKILSDPQLTGEGDRQKFWLASEQVEFISSKRQKTVTGKLYVTLPLADSKNLHGSQRIGLQGRLYRPRSPQTPGAFNFPAYLAQKGTFAGFKAEKLLFATPAPAWGWGQLRQRIVQAQAQWLPQPEATVLSSIALGQSAIALPRQWRDRFAQVGLAHVVAASGFQVALLLGTVLRLTPGLPPLAQGLLGIACLGGYLGLTGPQPSIVRAVLMGIGVLLAKMGDRQVRPLGSLLLTATILLAFNPLWIWDLGFQLSFLATLGLMVSLNPIQTRLDWLPPAIAALIALPLAANLWVMPLILQVFSTFPTYSLVVNVVTAPLVMVISLGGMISAITALILPIAGSAIAFLLWLPLGLLLTMIRFFGQLPLSSYAIGQIPPLITLVVYGVLIAIALGWGNKLGHWLLMGLIPILLLIPPAYQRLTLQQVTVLPTVTEPVLLIQDRGKAILIGGNDPQDLKYTINPYLAHQGINQLDCWLVFSPVPRQSSNCSQPTTPLSVQQLADHPNLIAPIAEVALTQGDFTLQWRSLQPPLLQIQFRKNPPWWVIHALESASIPQWLPPSRLPSLIIGTPASLALGQNWGGNSALTLAIAPDFPRHRPTKDRFRWITGRDGTIQWLPRRGWHSIQEGGPSSLGSSF